ncbi:MAG: C25 family cysteine peptidase, partial [Bacteroidota bacterium]
MTIYHSYFDIAEGFVGERKLNQTINMDAPSIYSIGPESKLNIRVVVTNHSKNNDEHEQRVSFNDNVLAEESFLNAKVLSFDFGIPTTSLNSTNEVKFEGLVNNKDRQKVAYIKLTYPRNFDFENKSYVRFSLPSSSSPQYLSIDNFNTSGGSPILYDLTNSIRIETNVSGGEVQVQLPASMGERQIVLFNPNATSEIDAIESVDFIDYTQSDDEFIIISNPNLYDDGQGNNWVQEYHDYRENSSINGYPTVIVDIQQLYDQFAYGINRHSISIRNFGHFVKKQWSNPKYFFLLGKARNYDEIRTKENLEAAMSNGTFQVPTFGTLGGGDNLLLSTNETGYPIVSVGRLSASTPEQVKIYLDKVIVQETNQLQQAQTITERAWRKRILHLGGGNAQEQPRFKSYLAQMEDIIEDNRYGAEVFSFFKTSSDPVQSSVSDQLTDLINGGISIMTLFGHASAAGFDFSIDSASSYDNEGHFPVILSLGCYSGLVHSNDPGISEEFVFTENKGAIGFIASTALATEFPLRDYGEEFYDLLGEELYGEGIGDVARQTAKNLNFVIGYLAGAMTLHGDPSIKVNVGDGPDYTIDPTSVRFDPNPISVRLDSFDLSFDIYNVGTKQDTSLTIEITQQLPSGNEFKLLVDSISTPKYKEAYTYTLPSLGEQALGENRFYVELDRTNQIMELPQPYAEQNNKLISSSGEEGSEIYFVSNELVPISPREFSIVNNPNVTLKASTSTTFLESQKYILEIDTTMAFNSPLMIRKEIIQSGGVVKWKPEISFQNDVVYYWRVSPDQDPDVGGYVWRNSSFLYQAGLSEGWNQSHYFQLQDNDYVNMKLDTTRAIQFIDDFKDLRFVNMVIASINNTARIVLNNDRSGFYSGTPDAAVA